MRRVLAWDWADLPRPGWRKVCLYTSGAGAIHLLNGLYDARPDHQPVGTIVGQQKHVSRGGDYQQEVRVERPEQSAAALDTAFAADRPFVIDVMSDPNMPPLPPHITRLQAEMYFTAIEAGMRCDGRWRCRARNHKRPSFQPAVV